MRSHIGQFLSEVGQTRKLSIRNSIYVPYIYSKIDSDYFLQQNRFVAGSQKFFTRSSFDELFLFVEGQNTLLTSLFVAITLAMAVAQLPYYKIKF